MKVSEKGEVWAATYAMPDDDQLVDQCRRMVAYWDRYLHELGEGKITAEGIVYAFAPTLPNFIALLAERCTLCGDCETPYVCAHKERTCRLYNITSTEGGGRIFMPSDGDVKRDGVHQAHPESGPPGSEGSSGSVLQRGADPAGEAA